MLITLRLLFAVIQNDTHFRGVGLFLELCFSMADHVDSSVLTRGLDAGATGLRRDGSVYLPAAPLVRSGRHLLLRITLKMAHVSFLVIRNALARDHFGSGEIFEEFRQVAEANLLSQQIIEVLSQLLLLQLHVFNPLVQIWFGLDILALNNVPIFKHKKRRCQFIFLLTFLGRIRLGGFLLSI